MNSIADRHCTTWTSSWVGSWKGGRNDDAKALSLVLLLALVLFALLAGIYLAASHAIEWHVKAAMDAVQKNLPPKRTSAAA